MMSKDNTPDDFPLEYLAAYADGELDAEAHAAVERWLSDHPEALDSLNSQREFGPGNASLWERAEPPAPSDASWATVRHAIESRLAPSTPTPTARRRIASWVLGGLATAIAASVAWVAFGPTPPPQNNENGKAVLIAKSLPDVAPAPRAIVIAQKPDPLAEFAVLPMATEAEVILDRVPDTRTGWLPIGRHPLGDTLLLATVDELDYQEVDLSPIWPAGGQKLTSAPGHAPMIFAAKPR